MVAHLRKKPATYDEVLALPDNVVGEILDGRLFASPRRAVPQASTAAVLRSMLGAFHRRAVASGPGGWWILEQPVLRFGADVMVPELAGWRRQRMPRLPSLPVFELAPDWVCEVTSPSTVRIDRCTKLSLYHRAQVSRVWLVDPKFASLENFGRVDNGYWSYSALYESKVWAQPFDAVELDLERLAREVAAADDAI